MLLISGDQQQPVGGLFDTGTTLTLLQANIREQLAISADQCTPQGVKGVGGVTEGLLTILDAQMIEPILTGPAAALNTEGATFQLPVVFVEALQTNLFGRTGLMDNFYIALEPDNLATNFSWEPGPEQWTDEVRSRLASL